MLALSALAGAALAPVSTLGHSLQSLQTVGVHLDRVRDVLEEPIEEVQEDAPKYGLSGQISLRNVSFRYGTGSPWALEGIDLEIPAHSRIAIVGASGSGKSTLARIITGLLQAEGGSISLDGHALKDLNLRHFRQQCGVVIDEGTIENEAPVLSKDLNPEEIHDPEKLREWLNMLQRGELEERMQKAIGEEKYESAKIYRDELNRRDHFGDIQ